MEIKRTNKIGFRMTIYCGVFTVLLSLIISSLGAYTYYENSSGHYTEYLRMALEIMVEEMDVDELERTIIQSEQNNAYEEAQRRFNWLKDHTDIKYIYFLSKTARGDYEYIICGYDKEELKYPDTLVTFQQKVDNEIDSAMISRFDQTMEGYPPEKSILNQSDLGYVMSLLIPVRNSQDKVIGLLAADILVQEVIIKDLTTYLVSVLIGTVIAMTVFLIVFLFAIKRKIIQPVTTIGQHADEFVRQKDKDPSQMRVSEIQIQTKDELELLARQLNGMMNDMVTYMSGLESMTALKERMTVQMDLAKQIQKGMLPDKFPAFPERKEFDIYAAAHPAGEVGGDFYDFFMIDGTHLCVIIGDVSGEGVPAALFMMQCKTVMKNYALSGMEPAKVFYETNNELCKNNDAAMTVEAFLGVLDVHSGEFVSANAGNHKAFCIKGGKDVDEVLISRGFLIGMLEHIPFFQETRHLRKGDILLLFTNGIFQMENRAGNTLDLFLLLENSLKGDNTYNIREYVELLETEMKSFTGEEGTNEDFTALAIVFEGYSL